MAQYTPFFVAVNTLIFAMWAAAFCCTLKRRYSMPVTLAGFVAQYLLWIIPPYFMPYASLIRSFWPLLLIPLPLFLLFRDKWSRVLFVSLAVLVFMYVSDIIPCSIVFTPEQMRATPSAQPLPQRLVAYAICISLDAFLLWMLVLFMNRYKTRLSAGEWSLYLLFPLSQYMLLFGWLRVCLQEMTLPRSLYIIGAMAVCVAADAALFLAVRGMAQRSELSAKNALLAAQIDRQKEHYAALTTQYEAIRRMRHDIAKHLYTMEALLQAGRSRDAADYSAEVAADAQYRENLGICENPVVDAYLYTRTQELRQQGYTVELSVRLPDTPDISNADLIIAFGNLLENAAEACRDTADKTICLTAASRKGYLSLETRNACPPPKEKQRRIPELQRGIGFHIFEELARKYDGSFTYGAADGRFTANLILKEATALAAPCGL